MKAIKEQNLYTPILSALIVILSICCPLFFGINSIYAQDDTLTFDWSLPKTGSPAYYYKIYQSVDSSNYDSIGTTPDTTFFFMGLLGRTYKVRVSAVDSNGIEGPLSEASRDTTLSGVDDTLEEKMPRTFFLGQNFPNPFNSTTAISYQLPVTSSQRSAVSLKIYNILGELVKTLVDKEQAPGYYWVVWDGRDNLGKEISSGIYYYQLQCGSFVRSRRMIFLK